MCFLSDLNERLHTRREFIRITCCIDCRMKFKLTKYSGSCTNYLFKELYKYIQVLHNWIRSNIKWTWFIPRRCALQWRRKRTKHIIHRINASAFGKSAKHLQLFTTIERFLYFFGWNHNEKMKENSFNWKTLILNIIFESAEKTRLKIIFQRKPLDEAQTVVAVCTPFNLKRTKYFV